MGQIIAVASGKGGTGKTTTVAAVASCLAALGYKTLCIDFDVCLRNLDLALCMADYAVSDFFDVINSKLDLMEACHESPLIANLFFLAAPANVADEEFTNADVTQMFADVRLEFDYCLVDAPSGIGAGFRLAHECADMSVVVTTGELPAMRDSQKAVNAARDMGVGDLRLLINRVTPGNYRKIHTTFDDVIDIVGARLIGAVREDNYVFLSLHTNIPLILYKKRRSAYDFLDVARRIAGEEIPLGLR